MAKGSILIFMLCLAACTTTRNGTESIKAGDGITFTHEFKNGVPYGAENEQAETFVGLVQDNGKTSWMFQLKFKNNAEKEYKAIFVYDVSGKPLLLFSDKKPQFDANKSWMQLKETDASWLNTSEDSFFIFKFLLIKKDGSKVRLYQPQNFTPQNKEVIRSVQGG